MSRVFDASWLEAVIGALQLPESPAGDTALR